MVLTLVGEVMNAGGYNFRPGFHMVSDWERAERNAFRNVGELRGWTDLVELSGCRFHFGMSNEKCSMMIFDLSMVLIFKPGCVPQCCRYWSACCIS